MFVKIDTKMKQRFNTFVTFYRSRLKAPLSKATRVKGTPKKITYGEFLS